MADFCWDCFPDLFGFEPEKNDLFGICDEDMMFGAICEGCGPGYFDYKGKRIEFDK